MADWKKIVLATGTSTQYIKGDGTFATYTDSLPLAGGTVTGSVTFGDVVTIQTDTSPAFMVDDANGDTQFQVNVNASDGAEITVSDGGSTEKVRFSARSGGNSYINTDGSFGFGIGTDSPTNLLHVEGAYSSAWLAKFKNTGTTNAYGLQIDTTANTTAGEISLGVYTGIGTGMFVTSDGKVGVGTTSPVADFVVSNNGNAGIELQAEISTDTNRITNYDRTANAYMDFKLDALSHNIQTSGSSAIYIDSNGKVGIGTEVGSAYYSDELVVEVVDNGGITIANTDTSHSAYIMFADGTSGDSVYRCQLGYDHNIDRFGIWTGATNALLIDSSQRLTTQNSITISHATPEIVFAVPSGGLDSRIHNDGSGNLIFGHGTNSSAPTEAMRIDSSQNTTFAGDTIINGNIDQSISTGSGSLNEFRNTNTGTNAFNEHRIVMGTGNVGLRLGSSYNYSNADWNNAWVYAVARDLKLASSNGKMDFYVNGSTASDIALTIATDKNATFAGNLNLHKANATGLTSYIAIRSSGTSSVHSGLGLGTADSTLVLYVDKNNAIGSGSALVLQTGGTDALTINGSQNATFAGDVRLGVNKKIYAQSNSTNSIEFYNGATGAMNFVSGTASYDYPMEFRQNDAQVMTIKTQRVGIGTQSPAELLHLESVEPVLRFTDSDDSKYHHIFASSDDLYISADRGTSGTGGNIIFRVGSTSEKMRIDGSGNVAIGSSGSGYRLDVRGTSGTFFSQTTATSGSMARLRANDGSTSVLQINADGNIGIGTESPEARLTVKAGTVGTTSLGGRSINYGVNINTTSGRSGVTVKPANNYAIGDDNAGFQWLYPFDDGGNGDFKAFRVSEGATLVDKFYATRDGQGYFASDVGIGSTSPNARLEVKGADGSNSTENTTLTDSSGNHLFTQLNGGKAYFKYGPVGIGATSPDGTLHVHTATAGTVTADTWVDDLVVENSGDGGISILTPSANQGAIAFGDPDDANRGQITYQHYTDKMTFKTNAVVGMTMDSSQNVGIGTSSPASRMHIVGGNLLLADGEADNAIKQGRMGSEHYDVDEEPFYYLNSIVQSGNNQLNIGGGTSIGNSATLLNFYTASSSTTTTGTLALTIDSSQNVGIGTSSPMANSDGIVGLEISSGASTGLTIKSTSSSQIYSLWADASGNFKINDNTNNANRLTMDSSGNVSLSNNLSLTNGSPVMYMSGSGGDHTRFGWTEGDPDVAYWRFYQNGGMTASITMDAFTENTAGGRIEFNSGASEVAIASIDSGGVFLGKNASGQNTTTELGGYGVLHTNGSRYGNYGYLVFNAPTNSFTASSRGWAITNGYQANKFALLQSTNADDEPILTTSGEAGTSTTVPLIIDNSGNTTLNGALTVNENALTLEEDIGGNASYVRMNYNMPNSTDDAYGTVGMQRTSSTTYLGMLISSDSRDGIRFNTANGTPVERMRIDASGRVGIGVDSPTKTLELNGSYKIGSNAFINYNATYPYTITVENTAGVGNLIFQAGTGSTGFKSKIELQGGNTATDASITLTTADTARMTILNNGKVGIGTTNPSQLLTLQGGSMYMNTGQSITWNNGDAQIGAVSGYHFRIQTYDGSALTEKMRITSGGNVGIGTTNPTSPAGVGRFLKIAHTSHAGICLQDTNSTAYDIFSADGHVYFYSQSLATNTVMVGKDGDVGIGSTNPRAKLHVAGGTASNGDGVYYYNNVAFKDGSYSETGTLKITLPNLNSTTMTKFTIEGYEYSGGARGQSWTVKVGGYMYNNYDWYNYYAHLEGRPPFSSVRLANDGSKNVILLGTTSTTWAYPKIVITEVLAGYNNEEDWGSGYSMSWITSETGIANIYTPTIDYRMNSAGDSIFGGRIRHQGELYINPATNLRLLGNVITFGNSANSTEFARFDSSGRLGIGNPSPDKTLVVQDGGAEVVIADTGTIPTLRFREGGATKGVVRTSSGTMELYSNGSSSTNLAMTIDSSQRVGIQQSVPTEALHVKGNIKASGELIGKTYVTFVHNFTDDMGTTAHTIPWSTANEGTNNAKADTNFVAPYPMSLVKIIIRPKAIQNAGTIRVVLKKEDDGDSTNDTVAQAIPSGNLASNTAKVVTASDFDVAPDVGILDKINIELSTSVDVNTSSTDWFVTTVWTMDVN